MTPAHNLGTQRSWLMKTRDDDVRIAPQRTSNRETLASRFLLPSAHADERTASRVVSGGVHNGRSRVTDGHGPERRPVARVIIGVAAFVVFLYAILRLLGVDVTLRVPARK